MKNQNVMGMEFGSIGSIHPHVAVWITSDGEITSEVYNLSDSTGGHEFDKPHLNIGPILDGLLDLRSKALATAVSKLQYREARRRVTTVENLEFAYLACQGRGGHTIYVDEERDSQCQIQGYGLRPEELAEIDRLGIPYVDTRTVPDANLGMLIRLPMWPGKPDKFDPAPWGGMSFAPIEVLAWMHQQIGSTVRNVAPRKPEPGQIRDMHKWEMAAIRGYQTGDTALLSSAMSAARGEA